MTSNSTQTSRLNTIGNPQNISATTSTPAVTMEGNPIGDNRVRISMYPNSPLIYYLDNSNILLSPLVATGGVLFPFQPSVNIAYAASYQPQKVSQNNFTFNTYENSEIQSFSLSCDFPSRNVLEAQYVVACIMFLRSLTFSFTANDSTLAGNPPLVVRLSGMGFAGLDYIPVAISSVSTAYADDVDYITIPVSSNISELTRIPTSMNISVNVIPMFSREFSSTFSSLAFSKGMTRLLGPNGETLSSVQATIVTSGPATSTLSPTTPNINNVGV